MVGALPTGPDRHPDDQRDTGQHRDARRAGAGGGAQAAAERVPAGLPKSAGGAGCVVR